MKFYREKGLKALQDSHESELFAITLNNMFDTLNRRFSAEGIRKNSKDLQVFICVACTTCGFMLNEKYYVFL